MISIDFNKTGFENLAALIEASNPGETSLVWDYPSLTEANVVFLAPEAYSDAENPTANTAVVIEALLDKGFSGDTDVTYYRPSLDEVALTPSAQIEVDGALYDEEDPSVYEAAVKQALATELGLNIDNFEFELEDPLPLPASENNPVTVNIVPVAGSFIYTGAPMAVTWAIFDTDIDLNTAIANVDLTGFIL